LKQLLLGTSLVGSIRSPPYLRDSSSRGNGGTQPQIGICSLYLTLSLPNALMAMVMLQANASECRWN
jgi:hypothetical protein